jgi:hypothetical protein
VVALEDHHKVEAQPLRFYTFRFPADQIRSKVLLNSLALRGRASSRLRKMLLIHQT